MVREAALERRGWGLLAIHIKAHAEDRKQRSQFTHHEEMNVRADELTHAITPSMPMYASFRRPATGETRAAIPRICKKRTKNKFALRAK